MTFPLMAPPGSERRYYAVARGRAIGVFHTWPMCLAQVRHFPGAVHKTFLDLREAHEFLDEWSRKVPSKPGRWVPVLDEIWVSGAVAFGGNLYGGLGVYYGHDDQRNISKGFDHEPGDEYVVLRRAALFACRAALSGIYLSIVRGHCHGPSRVHCDSAYVVEVMGSGHCRANTEFIGAMAEILREINEFYVSESWQMLEIVEGSSREARALAERGVKEESLKHRAERVL
ncbi:hypothetical protein DICA2_B00760 [Diutina catenulata]